MQPLFFSSTIYKKYRANNISDCLPYGLVDESLPLHGALAIELGGHYFNENLRKYESFMYTYR
jgi:hypothetical protein